MSADWWWELTAEERRLLDESARNSIYRLPAFPYRNAALVDELAGWAQLSADVLEAHIRWLNRTDTEVLPE